MKVLITGFKPFNKDKINPTEQILNSLKETYKDYEIYKLLLDVQYENDALKIEHKIEEIHPDIILMMGLAGGRNAINLEQIALNYRHATIKDNAGVLKINEKIKDDGPCAYETNIDLQNVINKVNSNLLTISYNAGTFICNDVYYSTLNFINNLKLDIKTLFIHFPFLPEQSSTKPTLELNIMIDIL